MRLARGECLESRRTAFRTGGELHRRLAQVEPQRRQHLIVARASEVDARAGRADARGEMSLERRLPVLVVELDPPQSAGVLVGECAEPGADRLEVGGADQALRAQHLRVRDRGGDIVAHQPLVQRVVLAGGVFQDARIERRPRVPQPPHAGACCSAGVSALTSATINVPVPSLVNTSPRIPSADR